MPMNSLKPSTPVSWYIVGASSRSFSDTTDRLQDGFPFARCAFKIVINGSNADDGSCFFVGVLTRVATWGLISGGGDTSSVPARWPGIASGNSMEDDGGWDGVMDKPDGVDEIEV